LYYKPFDSFFELYAAVVAGCAKFQVFMPVLAADEKDTGRLSILRASCLNLQLQISSVLRPVGVALSRLVFASKIFLSFA
jgi:hypothetical protein